MMRGRQAWIVAACLLAAAPGVMVLQVLPRITQDPARIPDLAAAALLGPPVGAFLGALLAGILARSTWRAGLLAGVCAQAASLPGYVETTLPLLEAGFVVDAAFVTALLYAQVVFSVTAGIAAVRYATGKTLMPGPVQAAPAAVFLAGALLLLAAALSTIGGPNIPWVYAVMLALGAVAQLWPVAASGRGPWRWVALRLMIAGAGVAAFAAAAVIRASLGR